MYLRSVSLTPKTSAIQRCFFGLRQVLTQIVICKNTTISGTILSQDKSSDYGLQRLTFLKQGRKGGEGYMDCWQMKIVESQAIKCEATSKNVSINGISFL